MKYLFALIILAVAGYFALQQAKPKPLPPPPVSNEPPPPPPPPLIDKVQEAKIVKAVGDQNPAVRWEALMLLAKMESPQADPLLFEKLKRDPDMDLRIKIIDLLQDRKGPEIARNLVGALVDQAPEVRVTALKALDKIDAYDAAPTIVELTHDSEDLVREQALRTLNSLQDKRAAEIAAAEKKRQEEEARRQAELAAQKKR